MSSPPATRTSCKSGVRSIPADVRSRLPAEVASRLPRLSSSPAEALRVAREVHDLHRDDIAAVIVDGVRRAFVEAQAAAFVFAIAAISLVLVLVFMPKAPSSQVDIAH